MKYDVFVSYRRTSFESANLIVTRLRAKGYRVFFDLEEMRSGPFNEQLYNVIEECKDFVLVLPPGALDNCFKEGDWVRNEVMHAIKTDRNIIPVMYNGFQWPSPMPEGMEKLPMYQGVASSRDFFDLSMERLCSYLKSRRYTRLRRFLRWGAGTLGALAAVYLIMSIGLKSLAGPVCEIVTEHLSMKVAVAETLLEDNLKLKGEWEDYTPEDRDYVSMTMDYVMGNVELCKGMTSSASLELSSWHRFLATCAGADPFTLKAMDDYLNSLIDDQVDNVETIRRCLDKEEIYPSEFEDTGALLDIFTHTVNAYFYSYLQVINRFPKSAQDIYYKMAVDFDNMPKTGLGLKEKDYEVLVEGEFKKAQRLMDRYSLVSSHVKDEVHRQEMVMDSTDRAIRDRYKGYVAKNAVKSEDTMGLNWGRICMIASFLDTSVNIEMEETEEEPVNNPIPPELVLGDLDAMLDDYLELYPSQEANVLSVKAFYRDVAAMKRPFAGVLVCSFAEGQSHSFYKIGDIITSWNGVQVGSYDELVAASKKKNGDGKLRLLRLENGVLKEIHADIPGNEAILGFNDLKS